MTKIFSSALGALLLIQSGLAAASDKSGQSLGLGITAGQTYFSGSLSDDHAAPSWGFEADIFTPQSGSSGFADAVGGFRGFFSVDFDTAVANASQSTQFPFTSGKVLSLSESALLSNLCVMTNLPVQGCLGIGWTQIQISEGNSNQQNYGAFRWDFRFGRFFSNGLMAGLKAHYYRVDQVVNSNHSGFGATSYGVVGGWEW